MNDDFKYKTYREFNDPHATLSKVHDRLLENNIVGALHICQSYFEGLEIQRQIDAAIEAHKKFLNKTEDKLLRET